MALGLFGAFIFAFSIGVIVLHIALAIWAYRDAQRSGKSPEYALLVLLALLFFPIMGLIIYLIIRGNDGAGYNRY